MQRYFLGIIGLFFFVMGGAVAAPMVGPERFEHLLEPATFLPLLDLFQVSGALAACMAILSVHPFVTDGSETVGMDTPFAHPGGHTAMLLAVVAGLLWILALRHPDVFWQAERVVQACGHLLAVSGVTLATVTLGFYPLRWKARLTQWEERDRRLHGHIQ
jgi:hypothetical protein